jgi:HD-GYP domain-containing protein (c-di-GMP phosphodiesterase class II)
VQALDIKPLGLITPETRFHPAPIAVLRAGMGANFEIYLGVKTAGGRRYILYKSRDYDLTAERRQFLIEQRIKTLYVTEEDLHSYYGYVEQTVGKFIASEVTPVEEKSQIIYQATSSLMEHLFERPESPILLRSNQKMVEHTIQFLASDTRLLRSIASMFVLDYSLYHHSVNVATISIGTALAMGYRTGHELEQLGYGFLFHDIGKNRVPERILRKPGVLTPTEMTEMSQHPHYGVLTMRNYESIEPRALDIIHHHHEKITGRGYPEHLTGAEISLPVRMCTVADIFDALTSNRSYKRAMTGFEALNLMRDKMKNELDSDCLLALISLLGPARHSMSLLASNQSKPPQLLPI